MHRVSTRNSLIPITMHAETSEVLMFAWMNAGSLAKTLKSGEAWYWSRSRNELWHKGATSGQIQKVTEIRTDCDQDVVLLESGPQSRAPATSAILAHRSVQMNDDGTTRLRFEETEKVAK